MGILDDAIREHLELKRAHGADESELKQKEAEAFGPIRQEAAAAADESAPAHEPATEMLRPDDLEDELHAAPDVHPDPNAAAPAPAEEPSAHAEPAEAPPTEAYDVDALQPAAEDPYTVHPGDHAVPDPHDHVHPGGSDPAWGDDTELFAEEPRESDAASAPAEAGAGTLEPSGRSEPGPPIPPDHHHDEQHPALHDHDAIHSEDEAPEPVFRRAEPNPPDASPEIDEPAPRQSAEGADGDEDVLEETPEFLQDAPEHDRLWFEQKPPRDFDFGE